MGGCMAGVFLFLAFATSRCVAFSSVKSDKWALGSVKNRHVGLYERPTIALHRLDFCGKIRAGKGRCKMAERIPITDDFLFGAIMRKKQYCIPLLEMILNIKIRDIEYVNEQQTISAEVPGSKSIRLDVYVEDDQNTVYDIEIQTTWKVNLPKRTRMYQSMIDIRAMEKGQDYTKLKKSYVIFICVYDPFQSGRYFYSFSKRCNEEPDIVLEDDATIILLNTKGTNGFISPELKELLEYFDGGAPQNDYTKALDEQVEMYNADEKWRMERMTLMDAYATQREIGQYNQVVASIRRRAKRNLALLDADYAEDLGITFANMTEVIGLIQQHPEWDDAKVAFETKWKA